MTQEEKQLVLTDICARLPYGVKAQVTGWDEEKGEVEVPLKVYSINTDGYLSFEYNHYSVETVYVEDCRLYLRPMSSMTDEEAKEIVILHGIKDILSIKLTDEYIEVVVDDGVCSTETRTIWYDEIISSIEIFDWLNKHHLDYRGLIEKGLVIQVTEENNPYKYFI